MWFWCLPQKLFSGLKLSDFVKNPQFALTVLDFLPEDRQSAFFWLVDLCLKLLRNTRINGSTSRELALMLAPILVELNGLTHLESIEVTRVAAKVLYWILAMQMAERVNDDPGYLQNELSTQITSIGTLLQL